MVWIGPRGKSVVLKRVAAGRASPWRPTSGVTQPRPFLSSASKGAGLFRTGSRTLRADTPQSIIARRRASASANARARLA